MHCCNPFESALIDTLHQSVISPSVFKTSTPGKAVSCHIAPCMILFGNIFDLVYLFLDCRSRRDLAFEVMDCHLGNQEMMISAVSGWD